jgi:hypothetical protein
MPENDSKKDFIAYYDERDGKGYIKGSKESTFKNMVKITYVNLINHRLRQNMFD